MQKSKSGSKFVKKSCSLRVKPGIPVPVDVVPVPDPTGEKFTRPDPYPRVRVGSGIPTGTGRSAHLYSSHQVSTLFDSPLASYEIFTAKTLHDLTTLTSDVQPIFWIQTSAMRILPAVRKILFLKSIRFLLISHNARLLWEVSTRPDLPKNLYRTWSEPNRPYT